MTILFYSSKLIDGWKHWLCSSLCATHLSNLHLCGFFSYDRSSTYNVFVGKKQLIEGMDKGLVGMCVNERRLVKIPPQLAYGKRGYGVYVSVFVWVKPAGTDWLNIRSRIQLMTSSLLVWKSSFNLQCQLRWRGSAPLHLTEGCHGDITHLEVDQWAAETAEPVCFCVR